MKRYQSNRGYEPEVLEKLHGVQLEMLEEFIKVCEKYDLTYFAIYGTAIGAVRHQGFIPWDDDIDVGMLREDYNKFLEVFEEELGEKYALLTPEIDDRYACTVTHIQRKGTKFISEASQDLKCEQCIFMDIFPFDYVACDKKKQLKQARLTSFWGKLLFLSGTAYPVIPFKGFAGRLAEVSCKIIHYLLKIFHVSPRILYKKYLEAAIRYNCEKDTEYVTSFEYAGAIKDKVRKEEMYPLQKVKFEHLEINLLANNDELLQKIYGDYMKLPPEAERVNHMPLVIDFGDK